VSPTLSRHSNLCGATPATPDCQTPPISELPGRPSEGWAAASDSGAITVVTAWVLLALFVVAGLVAQFGVVLVTSHRAQNAADLAALAAAGLISRGEATACERAADVVDEWKGSIQLCRIDALEARVGVTAQVPILGVRVSARARAAAMGLEPSARPRPG
jgi:secretion/DNA translocation related TadE-like protein